ncbi:MAG: hypothetical protein ACE5F1_09215 [Planctomycetota bacterium]
MQGESGCTEASVEGGRQDDSFEHLPVTRRWIGLWAWFGVALSIYTPIHFVLVRETGQDEWPYVVLLLLILVPGTAYLHSMHRLLSERIDVDETGMERTSGKTRVRIAWSDVRELRHDERRGRTEVVAADGRSLSFEDQILGYAQLLQRIEKETGTAVSSSGEREQ